MVKYITMVQMELQWHIPKEDYGIKLTSISSPQKLIPQSVVHTKKHCTTVVHVQKRCYYK